MQSSAVNVPLEPRKRNLVFAAMLAQYFGFMFTSFAPGLAVPKIMAQFNKMEYFALVSVLYSFFQCIVAPVAACLGDRIGRKWILSGSLFLMCLASVGVYFAPNVVVYLAFWSLSGALVGGFLTGPFLVTSDIISAELRPKYMGYLTTAMSAGMIVAPVIGGVIVDAGWIRGVYFLPIPFYLFAAIVLIKYYPKKAGAGALNLDGLGVVLLFLAVAPFVVLLNFGGSLFPCLSPVSIGCVVLIVVFGILLIRRELKIEQPAVDFRVLKSRTVRFGCANRFLANSYAVLTAGFVVLLGQEVLHVSASVSGTLMLPQTIVSLLCPFFLTPWISKDARRYKTAFILEGVLGAATLIGISTMTENSSLIFLYALMALGGISYTVVNQCVTPYMQFGLEPGLYGAGEGTSQFFGVLGVTLTGSLFGLLLGSSSDFTTGLSRAFLAGGLLCLSVAVLTLFMVRRPDIPDEL